MNWLTLLAPQTFLIRAGAILLLAAAIFSYGWVKGAGHVQDKLDAQTANLEAANLIEVQRLASLKSKVETVTVERIKYVRRAAEVITKEVPIYVTAKDDAACSIPAGFVGLLNRAAQGDVPEAGSAGRAAGAAVAARPISR